MKRSESIGQLAAALAAAQGEYLPVQKDAVNPHLQNRYATLAALVAATRPALSKQGLAVTQTYGEDTDSRMVVIETLLMHGASGEWILSTARFAVAEQRGLNPLQQVGVVAAYLRRYGYAAITGVTVAEDDDDGAGMTTTAAQTRRQAEPAAPAGGAPTTSAAPAAPTGVWAGPGQCPTCKAPEGKRHASSCKG